MSYKIDMKGRRFGRLVVIEEVQPHTKPSGQRIAMYKCICDCGNVTVISGTHLRTGHNKSCGCMKAEQRKHGMDRLARIWINMVRRCHDPKATSFLRYGEKGIYVCDEWLNDFSAFKTWAIESGYRDDLTLDRIDNAKGYEPGNCRWATYIEQANNKTNNVRIVICGQEQTMAETARRFNVSLNRIWSRKAKGWSDEEIEQYLLSN